MSYRKEITIFILPPTPNARYSCWQKRAEKVQEIRDLAQKSAMVYGRPKYPLKKCRVTCTRFSSVEPDFDNLAGSFKPILDGFKIAGIFIDDKSSVITERAYLWEKTPARQGRVTVLIEELSA
jgi:Holliday junction resolvase RusA-like endonuclease